MTVKISLCMICRNEAQTLFRCLHHVKDLVDEIIIVDTGSTDGTKRHASCFTDQIFSSAWHDDFSEARNFSLSKANGDWILVLDADEVIYRDELEELRRLMRSDRIAKFTGIVLDRYEFEVDYTKLSFDEYIPWPNIETEVQPKLRLMKNTEGLRYIGRIHESLDSTARKNLDIRPRIRFAHLRDKRRRAAKGRYYMELEIQALTVEPRNSNAHYNVLLTYFKIGYQNQFSEALDRISYIQPRFLGSFDALRERLEAKGWEREARRIDRLIRANTSDAS